MSSPNKPEDDARPAGQIKHDASGRAVWEWAADTGRNAIDSTSRLLKRLDIPGLKLQDDEKDKETETAEAFGGPVEKDPVSGRKGSFNPYDNRAPAKRSAPAKPVAKPVIKPIAPQKKSGFFARLFGSK
jgi:hypothetical protein